MPTNSTDVANIAFPYVKKCMEEYKGSFFLKMMTRPFLFKLTRMGIEVGVVMARPKVEPILEYLIEIFKVIPDSVLESAGVDKKFVISFLELVQTPKEAMLPSVQQNFAFLQEPPHEH